MTDEERDQQLIRNHVIMENEYRRLGVQPPKPQSFPLPLTLSKSPNTTVRTKRPLASPLKDSRFVHKEEEDVLEVASKDAGENENSDPTEFELATVLDHTRDSEESNDLSTKPLEDSKADHTISKSKKKAHKPTTKKDKAFHENLSSAVMEALLTKPKNKHHRKSFRRKHGKRST